MLYWREACGSLCCTEEKHVVPYVVLKRTMWYIILYWRESCGTLCCTEEQHVVPYVSWREACSSLCCTEEKHVVSYVVLKRSMWYLMLYWREACGSLCCTEEKHVVSYVVLKRSMWFLMCTEEKHVVPYVVLNRSMWFLMLYWTEACGSLCSTEHTHLVPYVVLPPRWSNARATLDKQSCVITSTLFEMYSTCMRWCDLNFSCLSTSITSAEVSSCQNKRRYQIQYGRPCLHFVSSNFHFVNLWQWLAFTCTNQLKKVNFGSTIEIKVRNCKNSCLLNNNLTEF